LINRIDLHTHTTASDGLLTPKQLIDLALERGLRLIAITDHDSTDGVGAAIAAAAGSSLEVWSGVEISTDVPRAEVHMLGYFVDHHQPRFQATLSQLRESRIGRGRQMVEKLGSLGMPITWARVQELAGAGAVGRPHVAQALVEAGYVSSFREAFDRYIGRNVPAYVERYKLTPAEAIQLILQAGGLPSLAHPIYIGAAAETGAQFDLRSLLPELIDAGLAGIEAYYADYSPETSREILAIAREFRLIPTGGTDFHGLAGHQVLLGEVVVPEETPRLMLEWRKSRGTV
jgi:3',5'-nucleoside bisphosphate phosphatase